LIRPAADAELLRYDVSTLVGGMPKDLPRIYEELAPALSGVESDLDGNPLRAITEGERRAVLDWCGKYGLLGLLHHEVRMLVLAPRWRITFDPDDTGPWVRHKTPYQISYVRTARGWAQSTRVQHLQGCFVDGEKELTPERMLYDEVARLEDLDLKFFENPKALSGDIRSQHVEIKSLRDAMGRFFPSPPTIQPMEGGQVSQDLDPVEVFACPTPDSDEFWVAYGEPLVEVVRAFKLLARGMQYLQGPGWFGWDIMDGLLAPVGLGVGKRDRSSPAEKIITPTLLSAMAVAVGHAVADGRRGAPCKHCGRLFFTHKKLGLYCSPAHRRAAQNKRVRTGVKKKAKTAKKGA
jgi:hypothetical protein